MSTSRTKVLRFVVVAVLSIIWISPIVAIFIFSFAPNSDIAQFRLFPSRFTLENYETVLTTSMRGVSVPGSVANSALIVVIQVAGIIALDLPAAYALARLKFFGREIIFAVILLTLMMPGHVILMSLYELMANFSLVDTIPGIFLPGFPRVVGIFLMRQFFREIPNELDEAARLDGAGDWKVFLYIMVPLSFPAVATLTVITALYSWNNFLWPLIITNSPDNMTVPIAIAYLESGTNSVQNYADLLAAAFVTTLPILIIFLLAQKQIVRGLSPISGMK